MSYFKRLAVLTLTAIISMPVMAEKSLNDMPKDSLTITTPTFTIVSDEGLNSAMMLGNIKNNSMQYAENIEVELKYFDQDKNLIDSTTQIIYPVIAPPNQEVAFKITDTAVRSKKLYVSMKARVIDATFSERKCTTDCEDSLLIKALKVGLPTIFVFVMFCYIGLYFTKRKDSPQSRTLAIVDAQNELLTKNTASLERIADALEHVKDSVKPKPE